jgi:hypothetical protein
MHPRPTPDQTPGDVMNNLRKREMLRAYRERKVRQGIYAVRCEAAGLAWVAASRNLDSDQNRIWFSLRLGSQPNRTMQAAWTSHGEGAFRHEILEVVDDENTLLIPALLREREIHWREILGAMPVSG